MNYALMFFLGLPMALFFGYSVGIQFKRESWPQWLRNVCEVVVCFALVVDFIANMTVLSIYLWELPQIHELREWTFSTRLERLWSDTTWRGRIARPIARMLNFIDPLHCHIKAAKEAA
jgi:hypothetical protein